MVDDDEKKKTHKIMFVFLYFLQIWFIWFDAWYFSKSQKYQEKHTEVTWETHISSQKLSRTTIKTVALICAENVCVWAEWRKGLQKKTTTNTTTTPQNFKSE